MSYSTLATAAIVLGVFAAGIAVTAGALLCVGRRRLAQRALPVFLGVLAGVIVLAFAAVAESEDDLQAHAERTLGLASAAERTEMTQTGRYTISVVRLERVDRAFAADVKVESAGRAGHAGAGRRQRHAVGLARARNPRPGVAERFRSPRGHLHAGGANNIPARTGARHLGSAGVVTTAGTL